MRLATLALATVLAALSPAAAFAQLAQNTPAPTASVVTFRNQMPSSYRLDRVRLVVDGAVRYDGPNFNAAYLPPGNHVVEVIASYHMHNAVLSYLDKYAIEVRSAHVVRSTPLRPVRVDARAVPNGGATTPVTKSAVIAWRDH